MSTSTRAEQMAEKAEKVRQEARDKAAKAEADERKAQAEWAKHLAQQAILGLDREIEKKAAEGSFFSSWDLPDTQAGSMAASDICRHFEKQGFKCSYKEYKVCMDREYGCYDTGITVMIEWRK